MKAFLVVLALFAVQVLATPIASAQDRLAGLPVGGCL